MADVKIAVHGEAVKRKNGWTASPNTCLVRDSGKTVIVDPGNHPELLEILEMSSIWPEEIDVVFLTHYHLDHTLNTSLFKYAEVVDSRWRYNACDIIEHDGYIMDTDLRIIPTPGHSPDCSSLILDTDEGITAVCGDLFWFKKEFKNDLGVDELMDLKDELAFHPHMLRESRKRILEMADRVIPGHGRPFRVPRYQ
ncbi:MAG: MBL fold metallo-hydrolase [Thermoplasmatota archaeon]